MKKLFFFFAILIAISFQATSISAQSEWGSWQTATCHSKIQFRVRRPPDRSVDEKFGYFWYIQFKNNSSKSVAFDYTMKGSIQENVEYIKLNGGQGRVTMKPNSTDDGLSWQHVKNPSEVFVVVGYFRSLEPGQTDVSTPFEGCDNTKTLVDDLCFNKPRFSCPNYEKDKDKTDKEKTDEANAKNHCDSLYKKFDEISRQTHSRPEGISNGKQAISLGQELISSCSDKMDEKRLEFIKSEIEDIKKFIAKWQNP